MAFTNFPEKQGLYDPANEKDSCGVGFVVDIEGKSSNKILQDAKTMLIRMSHRGACACDNMSGDGSGVMTSIPVELFAKYAKERNIELPPAGRFAVGSFFVDFSNVEEIMERFAAIADELSMKILFWKKVGVNTSVIGDIAKSTEPLVVQVFVTPKEIVEPFDGKSFRRRVYLLRKHTTHIMEKEQRRFYICSLSSRTIVYKGQFTTDQLWTYYEDLCDPDFLVYMAIVHHRFSTNTFPSWERAHPNRMLAHNGEINTLRGNVNYMRAREGVMRSTQYGSNFSKLYPVIESGMSDSGSLDNVLEFLYFAGGRTLPETVITMIPEAWHNDGLMTPEKRAFYRWAAYAMEPWDGPALLTFSDGRYVGAILDRNGLRPTRYYITDSNVMYMSSEVGVVDLDPAHVIKKGRLKAGRMLLVDIEQKLFLNDEAVKQDIAAKRPVKEWMESESLTIKDLYAAHVEPNVPSTDLCTMNGAMRDIKYLEQDRRLSMFGYTNETFHLLVLPMIKEEKEALGSMGNDAPFACLSSYNPLVFEYFKQLFAQVTNPPIDPFREKIVMTLACPIGPENNILEPSAQQCHRLWLENPILSLRDIEVIKATTYRGWKTCVLDMVYPVTTDLTALKSSLEKLRKEAEEAVRSGFELIVLSDRKAGQNFLPIPSLMAQGAVHHHLIELKLRMKCGIIIETGEAREVHHFCTLIGYGADAICPYLVFESMAHIRFEGLLNPPLTDEQIFDNYVAAVGRGIYKVMAKMGISTLHSYKGAQIFEIVGLCDEVVDMSFRATSSRLGGATFEVLAREILARHAYAYSHREGDTKVIPNPGFYHYRHGGEKHMNDPTTIANLQDASINSNKDAYHKYVESADAASEKSTLRGQLDFVYKEKPVPLEEVEPATEIIKRFSTGAMSFGSISFEAHSSLAIAMNRVGAKSNTGEGGETPERYLNEDPNNSTRSAIKQVASARFGVNSAYLAHADEIQIKMAQGAKPGEGGELPGHKVTKEIAKTRHSVPGVGLISPPPHHDIYSIEDLAQLIYDLKAANPRARVSVKLVSEVGVGVIAAGVVKGKAEHVTISGHDGGTGASSWTGIKHAGLPWELGIAETHQTLVLNNLRSRIGLQADGQMRTGRDVIIAAMLGADEFGMSTVPLMVLGCTMMRKCHLNTCPVGVATQDPVLRKKFQGKPEHLVNFLFYLAEEIREYMARLGFTRLDDLIGRVDLLKPKVNKAEAEYDGTRKRTLLDFSKLITPILQKRPRTEDLAGSVAQNFDHDQRIDYQLIEEAMDVLEGRQKTVELTRTICNQDRAFGSTLSYEVSRRFVEKGLPEGSHININMTGHGGQSFCAFLAHGIKVHLEGDANDYVGKGLSGGEVVIVPPKNCHKDFRSEANIIVGNVCLYGATEGKVFFRGQAAERFCVRNSGALAVVEGVGDHCCEYMTGGTTVVLGSTGRNFAAGMSGGVAFVLDPKGGFEPLCNMDMVELVPVTDPEDVILLENVLKEFQEKTGSKVAEELLKTWPQPVSQFVKVFPFEYQRALKELASEKAQQLLAVTNGSQEVAKKEEPVLVDMEDMALDDSLVEKSRTRVLDKMRGFVKYPRASNQYRPVEERLGDWKEIYNHAAVKKNLKMQAARCMECGVPFCQSHTGCPLGNIIPKWNDLVFKDNWEEALRQLLQTNNFPEFTGRCCPAPCEGACVLGINSPPVTIKNIECAIIDHAWEQGWMVPEPPPVRTGKKVVVIGSGPAGLAAAAQLNRSGHLVTVLERKDRIGGLLRYGIPSMKMDKDVVQRRVDHMTAEGITFETGVEIGANIKWPAKRLVEDFDATVLCTGATWPRDIPIPGRQLNGIYFAMSFLEKWQRHQHDSSNNEFLTMFAKDKKVVVLGGGDTGVDCIGTALRQGAKDIVTFEILPPPPTNRASYNPWPTWPRIWREDYGHGEVKLKFGRDPRNFNIMSKRFLDDGAGNVTGVETVQVEWTRDESGRWNMKEVADSEKIYECDMVLLAMGFLGPEKAIIDELSLDQDPRSNIKTPQDNYRTSLAKVYAAGDCRKGQSLVVHAINEGRQAARQIDLDLMGTTTLAGLGGVVVARSAIKVA